MREVPPIGWWRNGTPWFIAGPMMLASGGHRMAGWGWLIDALPLLISPRRVASP